MSRSVEAITVTSHYGDHDSVTFDISRYIDSDNSSINFRCVAGNIDSSFCSGVQIHTNKRMGYCLRLVAYY